MLEDSQDISFTPCSSFFPMFLIFLQIVAPSGRVDLPEVDVGQEPWEKPSWGRSAVGLLVAVASQQKQRFLL